MTPGGIYQSRASVSQQEGVLLESYARETAGAGFLHEEMELVGGEGVVEPFGADVGDAVAFGVVASGPGGPGEIEAKAVGRGEAGTFADEEDDQCCAEALADLVAHGYPALEDDMERGETPALEPGQKGVQQRRSVPCNGQGGEAVATTRAAS